MLKRGFTLIELLIVISIIIILVAFTLISIRGQTARAADAKRKSDLYILKNSIEEYSTDKGSYPPMGAIDSCGQPFYSYLKSIPCDPQTRSHYGYFPSSATSGYRICAVLSDKTDPAIAAMGCDGTAGCGLWSGYNYCLAQGTTPSAVGTGDELFSAGSTPTPTSVWNPTEPTATPVPGNHYACAPFAKDGISYCNYYANPEAAGCPVTYPIQGCNNDCYWNPTIQCRE